MDTCGYMRKVQSGLNPGSTHFEMLHVKGVRMAQCSYWGLPIWCQGKLMVALAGFTDSSGFTNSSCFTDFVTSNTNLLSILNYIEYQHPLIAISN